MRGPRALVEAFHVRVMSSMEDLEVFPRQAVIVKNGKIFVEDEPFFCGSGYGDNDDGDDVKCEDYKPDIDSSGRVCPLPDSNKSNDDDVDDFESEKENRIGDGVVMGRHHDDEEEEEEEEDGDDGEEYDEEERFLRLVDREEYFEDVDGLRLQGLPDGPVDPAHYLDYIQ